MTETNIQEAISQILTDELPARRVDIVAKKLARVVRQAAEPEEPDTAQALQIIMAALKTPSVAPKTRAKPKTSRKRAPAKAAAKPAIKPAAGKRAVSAATKELQSGVRSIYWADKRRGKFSKKPPRPEDAALLAAHPIWAAKAKASRLVLEAQIEAEMKAKGKGKTAATKKKRVKKKTTKKKAAATRKRAAAKAPAPVEATADGDANGGLTPSERAAMGV